MEGLSEVVEEVEDGEEEDEGDEHRVGELYEPSRGESDELAWGGLFTLGVRRSIERKSEAKKREDWLDWGILEASRGDAEAMEAKRVTSRRGKASTSLFVRADHDASCLFSPSSLTPRRAIHLTST